MTNWITEARLAHQDALESKLLCFVCDKPHSEHGSYPTCATHPYSPDGRCGHVGTFADGRFTGVPCAGAECKNGCMRAAGVPAVDERQRFEAKFPKPDAVTWNGSAYEVREGWENSYRIDRFIGQWEAWLARDDTRGVDSVDGSKV